jgi:hypothetical protein
MFHMNTRTIRFLFILCMAPVISGLAYGQSANAGRTMFSSLFINHGARDAGMAGASIALPNDLAGFYTNPAALGYITRVQTFVGFRTLVLDAMGGSLGAAYPTKSFGVISANAIDVSEGAVDEVLEGSDGLPNATGRTWSSNGVSGGLSWSKVVWEDISIGASVRGLYHRMAAGTESYSADGFVADVGLQYRLLGGRFIAGAVGRNLGFLESNYASGLDNYPLPFGIGAGLSYVPYYIDAMRIALDVEAKNGDYTELRPGLEFSLFDNAFKIRGGYPFSSKDAEAGFKVLKGESTDGYVKSSWTTFCLGAGFSSANMGFPLDVDAALEFHSDFAPSVIVSLLYSW